MEAIPTERPQAPDPDAEAEDVVRAHVELRETKGGKFILEALKIERDGAGREMLDNPRLTKKQRHARHVAYITLRDFLAALDEDFQAALIHLHTANKLDVALIHFITKRPAPEDPPAPSSESNNPFDGPTPPPDDQPEEPNAPSPP